MSYARFSTGSDVYVFMNVAGFLECCGCSLDEQWAFGSTQEMADHLGDHRAAGHTVPEGVEEALWRDDRANWVDFDRCDLEGCEKRAQCGSPTQDPRLPGGYVSACSVEHAQQLGGFSGWPEAFGPGATTDDPDPDPLEKPEDTR